MLLGDFYGKLVLSEHDLSAHWGINVKTLQRWGTVGRGPRFMKIGRTVTYLPKDIAQFEAYSLYGDGRGGAIVQPPPSDMDTPSSSRSLTKPRTAQQEVVDLVATALLRLRAAGPPPENLSQTITVNEVGKHDLVSRRFGTRELTRMRVDG